MSGILFARSRPMQKLIVPPVLGCAIFVTLLLLYFTVSLSAQNGITAVENSPISAVSGSDNLWADSSDHRWKVNSNGGLGMALASQDLAFWPCTSTLVTGGIVYSGAVPLNGSISQETCLYFPTPQVNGVPLLVGTSAPQWGAEYLDLQSNALVSEFPNNTAGTTANYLVTLIASTGASPVSQVETASSSQVSGVEGICTNGCGTSGTAQIAREGIATCAFDGNTTANDYVQSSSTAGKCHDAGSSYPSNGTQVLGRVLSTQTSGAGNYAMVLYDGIVPLGLPLAAASGGTGLNSSSSTGVAQVSSGTWSVSTALANGTTASVQSVGDSSGDVATDSFISQGNFFGPSSAYSNATTGATNVGVTSPTIAVGAKVLFHCDGAYYFSTTGEKLELGINASQTPQAIWYNVLIGYNFTTAGASAGQAPITVNDTLASGGGTAAGTGATSSYPFQIFGYIQWNGSTAGTFQLIAATSSTSGTVNIAANNVYCWVH
jgi:hypothetical protein